MTNTLAAPNTPMNLLDDESLERSSVVANSLMNRHRGAVGVNSYEKELGLDPIRFLLDRASLAASSSWLDIACGNGRALIDAARKFSSRGLAGHVALHGVDLVDMFEDTPPDAPILKLESASVHRWVATGKFDLITCVHGLHYLGDKLALIERAAGWLTVDGLFLANLDLRNLRQANGQPLAQQITRKFRQCGLAYNSRRHLLSCIGAKSVSLGYQYLGADDMAGPNYSGQQAVDSYYQRCE